ncbi:MAG: DUF2905 domain-containing protein [Acidobacteria bacterium]|nr:DUF2905 domain-containing protein [Acidobacteriota bacterium]
MKAARRACATCRPLPGDIVIDRNGFKLYLPIVTCIVVSLVLTAVSMLLRR